MGLFGNTNSSASQTTNTASGGSTILAGKQAQAGTINVGTRGSYMEGGAVNLSGAKDSMVTINSVDSEIVSNALDVVKDIQAQSAAQTASATAAVKASNDNLISLLGGTPASTNASSDWGTWLKWGGIGLAGLAVLFLLFRR